MDKKHGKNRIGEIYKNTPAPGKKPAERKGVIYTPSAGAKLYNESESRDELVTRRKNGPKPRPQAAVRKKPERRPQKSMFATFFIFVTFFSALACVVAFALVFSSLSAKQSESPSKTAAPTFSLPPSSSSPLEGKTASITAVVTRYYPDPKKLDLYDYVSGKRMTVYYDKQTDMKDKYGTAMAFGEFVEGVIVDAVYISDSFILKSLRTSVNSWSFKSVTGAELDAEMMTLTLSSGVYSYDSNSSFSYNNEDFDISQLDKIDVISIRGYGEYITGLEVVKGHGRLIVEKNEYLDGGIIELDTNLIFELTEGLSEKITEGTHRAVIKGTNIEPLIREFTLVRGESYTLSLEDLKYKSGRLSVSANVEDARLTVNGIQKPLNELISLPFGEYTIKVEKAGYTGWEQTIVFEEPMMELSAALEELVTTGSVTISTDPAGAEVYIDGVYVGLSPCTVDAELGQRTVAVRKAGYISVDFPLMVTEKNNYPLDITLQPSTIIW